MKLIDGKALADAITQKLALEVRASNKQVGLAIILVGNDEGSETYVRLKKEAAERIGIEFHLYTFPTDVKQESIEEVIDFLNADETVHGIIIQLPLPKTLDEDGLISRILSSKDADGFQKKNVERYMQKMPGARAPGLIEGIDALLHVPAIELKGKKAVIVANSHIFADPLKEALEREQMNVEAVLMPENPNLAPCRTADVVIVAVGKMNSITKSLIKDGAIIIDVGFNREAGQVYGDVDLKDLMDYDGYITPVPGGVGPMTVAMLLKRVVDLHDEHEKL